MTGLIKLPKLADVASLGMMSIAVYAMSIVVFVLATGFSGGGVA